jgi:hypothetical protein
MTSERRAAAALLALAAVWGVAAAFGACGGNEAQQQTGTAAKDGGEPDAGRETGPEDGTAGTSETAMETGADADGPGTHEPDVGAGDAREAAAPDAKDATALSDVAPPPGWERIPWLPEPCSAELFQPAGPVETVVPMLAWVPCTDGGGPPCMRTPVPVAPGFDRVGYAQARKTGGRVDTVLGIITNDSQLKRTWDYLLVYKDATPMASWLLSPAPGVYEQCLSRWSVLSARGEGVVALFYGPPGASVQAWIGSGSVEEIGGITRKEPAIKIPSSLLGKYDGLMDLSASDTLLYGHAMAGVVLTPLPSGPAAFMDSSPGAAWDIGRVAGDTVFLTRQSAPTAVWVRLPNAAPKPLIQAPKRWPLSLETDGTWMAWLEGVGDPDPHKQDALFDHTEVWKAPYSTDPAAIAATRQKIADLPDTYPLGAGSTAGAESLYAVWQDAQHIALFDLKTGQRHDLALSPADVFMGFAYVGRDEIWITVGYAASNDFYAVKRYATSVLVPPLP